jgi:hypothetical protein
MDGWRAALAVLFCALLASGACVNGAFVPPAMRTWAQSCEPSDVETARAFWKSSTFAGLDPEDRSALLERLLYCAWDLDDDQLAHEIARAARRLGTPASAWLVHCSRTRGASTRSRLPRVGAPCADA